MVAPRVFNELVFLHIPVIGAEDVVDAEPASHGLEAAGPLRRAFQEGILHACGQGAVGVGTGGIVEIPTNEGGEIVESGLSF